MGLGTVGVVCRVLGMRRMVEDIDQHLYNITYISEISNFLNSVIQIC